MKKQIINEDSIDKLAELFKAFSDSTRIKILLILFDKEKSVNEIADELNMSQSAISHQLKNLKNAKLIKNRREGQTIFYSLLDEHVHQIIEQASKHAKE